jgi:hypothetical protein
MKLKLTKASDGRYLFYCEGCERVHAFNNAWEFDGNFENPTISPSLLVTMPRCRGKSDWICHSFIKDGKIQYLNDCSHDLAGQTVELLDEDLWFE